MKRVIICVFLAFFSFSSAYAQLLKGYGLKGGVVVADQDYDFTQDLQYDTETRTGWDVGIFAEWLDLRVLSVLTEVHYIQKGHVTENARYDEFGKPQSINFRFDYLSVPILAKFTLRTQYAMPYLVIGPRFDYLLSYESEISKELYGDFKNVDVGGTIGVGLESRLKPVKFLLEFRYSPDFSNAYKSDFLKVKNNSFEVLLGLML
jgi:hypothetical protein